MPSRFSFVMSVFLALAVVRAALAVCPCTDICYTTSGSGTLDPSDFDCTYDSTDDVYNISIIAAGSSGGFTIDIEASNDIVINEITVKNTGSSGSKVILKLTGGAFQELDRVHKIVKDMYSTGEVWISEVNATGGIGAISPPFGEIVVDKIGSLSTGGDITAPITVAGAASQAVAIGSITCGGDLMNRINAGSGNIGSIAIGGQTGNDGNTSGYGATVSNGSLDEFICADFAGTITVLNGSLRRFEINDGDFLGGVVVQEISGSGAEIVILGHFRAGSITVAEALTAPIKIGGTFGSAPLITTSRIVLPGDGLSSQVFLNQQGGAGEWGASATVEIGSTVLSQPEYLQTSASMGGGSVGHAPFHLHRHSSFPDYGAEHPGSNLSGLTLDCVLSFNAAYIQFYGPIATNGAEPRVVVEYKEFEEGVYEDVSEDFMSSVDTNDSRRLKVQRTGGPWPLGSYKISRSGSKVVCAGVTGSPSVADFTHFFRLVDGCEELLLGTFDLNNDGDLTYAGDVGAWTGAPVDLTGDNAADEDDLEALLRAIGQFQE